MFESKRNEVTGEWRNYIMRSFSLNTCYSGDKIEKNETGGACSRYYGYRRCM
jgi:hypothetical protein